MEHGRAGARITMVTYESNVEVSRPPENVAMEANAADAALRGAKSVHAKPLLDVQSPPRAKKDGILSEVHRTSQEVDELRGTHHKGHRAECSVLSSGDNPISKQSRPCPLRISKTSKCGSAIKCELCAAVGAFAILLELCSSAGADGPTPLSNEVEGGFWGAVPGDDEQVALVRVGHNFDFCDRAVLHPLRGILRRLTSMQTRDATQNKHQIQTALIHHRV